MVRFDDDFWDFVDEAVQKLEQSWKASGGAQLDQFVPPPEDPSRETVLIALVKVDQEHRWHCGQQEKLEAYLDRWPELDKPAILKELVEAECRTRAAVDAPATADELQSRFPAVAAQIDLAEVTAEVALACPDQAGPGQAGLDTPDSRSQESTAERSDRLPLQVGQQFGRYGIRELLGEGGMGAVYRAYDNRLEREVALKIPSFDPAVDPDVLQRFLREAKAAAAVRHPNICPIHDAGVKEGIYYLTMALIQGESLATRITDEGLDPSEATRLLRSIAQAIAALHSAGVIHRDVKPSNVLIDQSGEPLLTDFGLARQVPAACGGHDESRSTGEPSAGPSESTTDAFLGTPAYMSPEQAMGRPADARSDVYGLGVVFYQMLTGRPPFPGPMPELLKQLRESEPPAPRSLCPALPAELEGICLKAMAKRPGDRYQSASELAEALGRYLGRSAARRSRSRLAWIATTCITVAALLLSISFFVASGPETKQPPPLVKWLDTGEGIAGIALSGDDSLVYAAYGRGEAGASPIEVFRLTPLQSLSVIDFDRGKYLGNPHGDCVLSGDGRYLFTVNYYGPYVSRADLKTGEITNLRLSADEERHNLWAGHLAITPDRRTLAVPLGSDGRPQDEDNDRLSVVDVSEGRFQLLAEVRLDDEPWAFEKGFSFSPDSRFAYLPLRPRKSAAATLCEVRLSPPCGVTRVLPFPEGELRATAVSRKHGCVFVSDHNQRRIWVVDVDRFEPISHFELAGHAPANLAIDEAADLLVALCPTTRTLFCLDAADGTLLANVNGLRKRTSDVEFSSDCRRLFLANGGVDGGIGVIELDDLLTQIVFASNRDGRSYQIYSMCAGGQQPVRLTDNLFTERFPRWSPDGRKIAFVSDREGPPRICIIDPQGTLLTILRNTDPATEATLGAPLDWSPDGRRIAFIGGKYKAIRVVDVETGEVETLLEGAVARGYAFLRSLCWRATDGAILFGTQDPAWAYNHDLFELDTRTLEVRQITDEWGDMAYCFAPAASPDGQTLAVLRHRGRHSDDIALHTLSPEGMAAIPSAQRQPTVPRSPEWFPDGRTIVYSADQAGSRHLYALAVEGGAPRQLTFGDSDNVDPDVVDRLHAAK